MTSLVDTAVIFLNWNSGDEVLAALSQLSEEVRMRAIIVDNGSSDWTLEKESLSQIPEATVVRLNVNGGYASGMNAGIERARDLGFKYAILLNADSRPTVEALEAMRVRAPGAGIVGIAQISQDSDGSYHRYTTAARGPRLTPRPFGCSGCEEGVHEVDLVTGAAILVDLECMRAIDGLDESFFHYKEEFDMCIRAHDAGFRILWCCSDEVSHLRGGSLPRSSPNAAYYSARNEVLLFKKHLGQVRTATHWRLWRIQAGFVSAGIGNRTTASVFSGLVDGFRGATGPRRVS